MFDAKSDVNRYLADHPPLVDVRRRSEEKGPEVRRSSRKKKEEIEREEIEREESARIFWPLSGPSEFRQFIKIEIS